MTQLACKLRDEKLQNVAAIVKKSVQEGGEQCESIDRLTTGPLYLHSKWSEKQFCVNTAVFPQSMHQPQLPTMWHAQKIAYLLDLNI